MGSWLNTTLGDVLELKRGYDLPQAKRHDGPVPVISSSGPSGWHDEAKVQAPGVVTGRYGTLGQVYFVDTDFWPLNTTLYVRDFKGNDPRFISYFLRSLDFLSYSDKAAVPGLNRNHLHTAQVRIPDSINEQKKIASILGALDDKIDLNQKLSASLDASARALFRDWFIDFGPTRAKAENRTPYLTPEIWDLFPNDFDDDRIPVGWRRERIGDHVVAKKGLSYKGAGLTDEDSGIPLHNLNSILEGGGYKNDGLKYYSGDYKPRHVVRPGDLIVANTEQGFDHLLIGYSALIPSWVGSEGLFSHHLFKVEPLATSPISCIWFHFALSESWFGEAIRRFSNGTTVNMLPADAFEIPEIIVPPPALVQAFDEFVRPILHKQEDAVGESHTLSQTLDLLLPKLMSGEIRLRDAEEVVEAVA